MKHRLLNLLVIAYSSIALVVMAQEAPYIITVPNELRPGNEFSFGIQALKSKQQVEVTATFVDSSDKDVVSTTIVFANQAIISLEIPSVLTESTYLLKISGTGGVEFNEEATVRVDQKTLIILIQTDKAIYKPEETVRYRIMAIYSDLKPYHGNFDIAIVDGEKNKLEENLNVKTEFGIAKGFYELSKEPNLGDWMIEVSTPTGDEDSKEFTVDEFVLPKIDVQLDVPKFFHKTMPNFIVTITAVYTYGKPVTGSVDITIEIELSYTSSFYAPLHRTAELQDGKATIIYSHKDLAGLRKSCRYISGRYTCRANTDINLIRSKTLKITAVVTDSVTGDKLPEEESSVRFEYYLHDIKFLGNTPTTFKPGMTWIGYVQVVHPDGSPPLPSEVNNRNLSVRYDCDGYKQREDGYWSPISELFTLSQPVPKGGVVVTSALIPDGMTSCYIRANFLSDISNLYRYITIKKFLSRAQQSLQVSIDNFEKAIEESSNPVTFTIKSTHQYRKLYMQISSKGKIVWQKTEEIRSNSLENKVDVIFNSQFVRKTAPRAHFMVWYVTKGEVIADGISFSVDGVKDVSVSFSKKEVKPAGNITLSIQATPKSYIGVLAVDQSVTLLKTGNDISQSEVLNELGDFDISANEKKCAWCPWPVIASGLNAKNLFKNNGIQILTNTYVHAEVKEDFPTHPASSTTTYYYYHHHYHYSSSPPTPTPTPTPTPSPSPSPSPSQSSSSSPSLSPSNSPTTSQPPLQKVKRVRKNFPQTWIFDEALSGQDGKVDFNRIVPDTITSWVASAFAVSDIHGLGISAKKANLVVFKDFFAQLDLPFKSIRGELLQLKVLVFNFLNSVQHVKVTLQKSKDGGFFAKGIKNKMPRKPTTVVQDVEIPAGDGLEVLFWIEPQKIGPIPIQVKAQSTQAADALRRTLLVEAEGEKQEYSKGALITLGDDWLETFNISYPDDVVDGSQRVQATATGDVIGPSIQGLEQLLRLPSGCGEQNMVGFTPNIYVLGYLEATGQDRSEVKQKAITNMKRGYQNELKYQHSDGSYSAFGRSDRSGSLWLTAYVIKSFNEAKGYITINQGIIDSGLKWILRNQGSDGSFKEPGRLLNTRLQGGVSKGTEMTAYVAITLMELHPSIQSIETQKSVRVAITNALKFIEEDMENVKEVAYTMSIVTYAFVLDNKEAARTKDALSYFDALAKTTDGMLFWKTETTSTTSSRWQSPYNRPPSNSIEMTSYGLLATLEIDNMLRAAKISEWLSEQRTSLGGYYSTQDTIIGLEALTTFAIRSSGNGAKNAKVDIKVTSGQGDYSFKTITENNKDLMQQIEINPNVNHITVSATGKGVALFQLNVFYNKMRSDAENGYSMKVTASYVDDSEKLIKTEVCASYNLNISSGMVLMQIAAFTGYNHVTHDLLSRYANIGLKRYEIIDNNVLVLYLDQLTKQQQCFQITSTREHIVENLQAVLASVMTYYETSKLHQIIVTLAQESTSEERQLPAKMVFVKVQ